MSYGPTNFRTTVIKSYHQDETTDVSQTAPPAIADDDSGSDYNSTADITVPLTPTKRRGRPKSSKNKPKITVEAFLTAKEEHNHKLSLTLRQKGKITASGRSFEASDKTEIDALINNDVF